MRLARYFSGSILTMTWLDRVLVLLVAALLALQLLGAGHHRDDHTGYSDNCSSCFFAHQVAHGLPDAEPGVVPVWTAQAYTLVPPADRPAPVSPRFLIPLAQAPPRA